MVLREGFWEGGGVTGGWWMQRPGEAMTGSMMGAGLGLFSFTWWLRGWGRERAPVPSWGSSVSLISCCLLCACCWGIEAWLVPLSFTALPTPEALLPHPASLFLFPPPSGAPV